MGLFSSKYETTVDTQVQRLVEDTALLDPNLKALLGVVFGDSTDIPAALQDTAMQGTASLFHKMFRYAERGAYFYGLPNVTIRSNAEGIGLAQSALEAELGEPATFEYMHYRPLNNIHMGWQTLTQSYGYSHQTNEIITLSATKPNPVYLDKMVAVHTAIAGRDIKTSALGSFEASAAAGDTPERPAWGTPGTRKSLVSTQEIIIDVNALESVQIHYVWLDEAGAVARDMFVVDLSAYDSEAEFYHAKYTLNAGGAIGYWLYDPSTNIITGLTSTFEPPDYINPGSYFPFALLRSQKTDRTTEALKDTEEYKTTEKLLSFIGVDFFAMGESLRGATGIDDTEQVAIMMGVPMSSTDPVELEYLFEYFSELYDNLPPDGQAQIDPAVVPTLDSEYGLSLGRHTSYAAQISDGDFEMNISFDYITKKLRAGVIGEVGTVTSSFADHIPTSVVGQESGFFMQAANDLIVGLENSKERIYRRQILAGVYEEVIVGKPIVKYRIFGEYTSQGSFSDKEALIPIDRDVARRLGTHKLSNLYQRSLHMVLNSKVVTETKWYQTGLFQAIIFVVALVVTIYTQNPAAFKAALATGAGAVASFLIIQIIVQLIVQVVVGYVFTKVVEIVGIENAFWIAVVAAFVAGANTIKNYSTAVSQGLTQLANNMLTVANGLVTGAQNVMEDMYNALVNEAAEWSLLAEAQSDELREIQRQLDSNIGLNPFDFIGKQPLFMAGETPDNYLNRTVGNGIDSYPKIENYFERSTRLPTIDETIGGLV